MRAEDTWDGTTVRTSQIEAALHYVDMDQLARDLDVQIITTDDLPHGYRGFFSRMHRLVTISPDLTPNQRRSTLAHELGHIILEHPDDAPPYEAQAVQWAVRELLPMPVLAAALAEHPEDLEYVALVADCTPEDVACRLMRLTEAEEYEMKGRQADGKASDRRW